MHRLGTTFASEFAHQLAARAQVARKVLRERLVVVYLVKNGV